MKTAAAKNKKACKRAKKPPGKPSRPLSACKFKTICIGVSSVCYYDAVHATFTLSLTFDVNCMQTICSSETNGRKSSLNKSAKLKLTVSALLSDLPTSRTLYPRDGRISLLPTKKSWKNRRSSKRRGIWRQWLHGSSKNAADEEERK